MGVSKYASHLILKIRYGNSLTPAWGIQNRGHMETFSRWNIYSTLKVFLPISTSFVSFCGGAIITGSKEKLRLSEIKDKKENINIRQALGGHQYKACIFIFLSFFTVMFLGFFWLWSMATNTHAHAYTHTHTHTHTRNKNVQAIHSLTTYDVFWYFLFSFTVVYFFKNNATFDSLMDWHLHIVKSSSKEE